MSQTRSTLKPVSMRKKKKKIIHMKTFILMYHRIFHIMHIRNLVPKNYIQKVNNYIICMYVIVT